MLWHWWVMACHSPSAIVVSRAVGRHLLLVFFLYRATLVSLGALPPCCLPSGTQGLPAPGLSVVLAHRRSVSWWLSPRTALLGPQRVCCGSAQATLRLVGYRDFALLVALRLVGSATALSALRCYWRMLCVVGMRLVNRRARKRRLPWATGLHVCILKYRNRFVFFFFLLVLLSC